jgi:hypothetical protein
MGEEAVNVYIDGLKIKGRGEEGCGRGAVFFSLSYELPYKKMMCCTSLLISQTHRLKLHASNDTYV